MLPDSPKRRYGPAPGTTGKAGRMVHLRLAADVDALVKAHAERHGLTFTAALEALARAGAGLHAASPTGA